MSKEILKNILDFNSDKRFMLILKSNQGLGKLWFINFIKRLFEDHAKAISYDYLINGSDLFNAADKILLIDHDISEKMLTNAASIKKLLQVMNYP